MQPVKTEDETKHRSEFFSVSWAKGELPTILEAVMKVTNCFCSTCDCLWNNLMQLLKLNNFFSPSKFLYILEISNMLAFDVQLHHCLIIWQIELVCSIMKEFQHARNFASLTVSYMLFLLNNRQKTNHLHSPMCFIDPKTLLDMSGNFLNEFALLFIHFSRNLTKNKLKMHIFDAIM